ncbi:MAG: ABC transporter ATP-binding protein [Pirellulales bacterium]
MTENQPAVEKRAARLDLRVWWEILQLATDFRWHAVGLAVMAVTIAVCEVLLPYLTGRIIDQVTSSGFNWQLKFLASQYAGIVVLLCLAILGFILLAGRVATGVSYQIREASFHKLQFLPFSYYDQRPVGWLLTRLTSDCDRLSRIIGWSLLDFVWAMTMVTGISIMMLWIHWQLALLVLAVVPALLVISLYFHRQLLNSARLVRRANSQITASFNENIMGVRTTKALVRETESLTEFQQDSAQMFQHSLQNAMQSAVYVPMVTAVASIMTGLALWQGGWLVLEGSLTIGTLIAFMNYAGLFFEPIQQMARQFAEIQMAQAAAERIQKLLNTVPAIADSSEVKRSIASQQARPDAGLAVDGGPMRIESIRFDQVRFAYENGQTVLEDFNLEVAAGETVALVGPTGGGKSTIVNLLCRFYEPTAGRIELNGTDYRQRSLQWLRSNLGIVLQTPHLFSGTIRDNLAYGNLHANEQQIVEAAKLVNADQFIRDLPGGYNTEVGEGGDNLSTGQKQLVALARAILADPQIFVMDEATSSVDTETEHLIQAGIDQMLKGRTSFVIAHRLSTIRAADRILVIEAGRIIESGNHEELLQFDGKYRQLCMNQFNPILS